MEADPDTSGQIQLNKLEATKKRTVAQAKDASWETHLSALETTQNASKFWRFAKSMLNGPVDPLSTSMPLIHNGSPVADNEEKANLLLDQYRLPTDETPSTTTYADNINEAMLSPDPHPLNSKFTKSEIMRCVKNLPSKAMGLDRVHNQMICRFSDDNLNALLHLVNIMLAAGYVPPSWKNAVIAPILKPNKPPTETGSYRPIALTSCLGKVMERMINNRLKWHIEKIITYRRPRQDFAKGVPPWTTSFDLKLRSRSPSTTTE